MNIGEANTLDTPERILVRSGFAVSERCTSRPSCFDFAARKSRTLVFVKSQEEIRGLSPHDLVELRSISESFSSASLLICERAREKPLEEDTVYTRNGVLVVTSKTFENFLVQGMSPLIQASPGGYYVRIDNLALRRRRQKLGLSVGDVADMVGISRRTIYAYERGMVKASVPIAYNIIRVLGIPVAKQVNIFDRSTGQKRSCLFSSAKRVFSKNRLLQRIMNKFGKFHITTVKRAPFDFVIQVPDGSRILGGVASTKEAQLNRRIDEILSISRIVNAHPVLITESERAWRRNIVCISGEEVSRMDGPEDLIVKVI